MNEIKEFFGLITNSEELLRVGGLVAVTLIVYAETGLFFCFFLPGDYLLFLAGMFCGTGQLDVPLLLLVGCLLGAAIAGNYTGYLFGRVLGHKLLARPDSFFFKKKYIESTNAAFEKYGGRALIIGRFLPIVRTFAPILAGIAGTRQWVFTQYNIIGALLWVCTLTIGGWKLGSTYKDQVMGWLPYIILFFITLTSTSVVTSYFKIRRDGRKKAAADAAAQEQLAEKPE